ncbi:restriction endonuclease subunit S [Methylomonas sp. MS20]|uniref:restriction endonuclease subunit S n=1 Tax=unclassified Methylomonas TaxID=2608980 RepID=UPI0028A564C5|nr:restriction endonuclease subunit S [Methylomonas sp. MV1]MDT4332003.1 restriction endonuclease subunit S [Methylomonas sp. MV1]
MTYPAYPQYKDSGVVWLGNVPEHWDVKRLKLAAHLCDKKVEANEENPLPYIGMENIESWSGKLLPVDPDIVPSGIANYFSIGTTLFGKLRPYLAKACNPDFDGLCSTELLVIQPEDFDRRALLYWLLADGFIKLVDSSTYGSKMPRANWDFIGNCELPVPPLTEQTAIADFLDRETGRIDTLVAKKRKLVELLKEKRSALISRTVTRGLPADATREFGLNTANTAVRETPAIYGRGDFNRPQAEANKLAPTSERPSVQAFKDSGVEWLGEIPSHWHVMPLFRITSLIQTGPFGSQLHASDYVEGGIPLINPAQIVGGKLVPDELCCVDESTADRLQRHKLQAGDIVMGRRGEIGRCALVTTAESGWICGTGSLLIRFINSDATYFSKVISNSGFVGVLELNAVGTTMLNLNPTIVGRMLVPAPTLQEQTAIATYLDRETAKIDRLVAKVETAITRLQEYRSALITAAVTGKIDVRGAL